MSNTNGDVETAEETKRSDVVLEETEHSGSEARTTSRKTSSGRILLQIDPSIVDLVSAVEASEHIDEGSEDNEPDQSHLFCNCMCDLVKTCVIANGLCLAILAITIFYSFQDSEIDEEEFDDDVFLFEFKQKFERNFQINILRNSIGIPFAFLGILGAVRFYKYLVLVVFLWYCAFLIWGAIRRMYLSAFMGAIFAYPHLALFLTLHKGHLTRENYKSLKQWC